MRTIELTKFGSSDNFRDGTLPITPPKKGEVRIAIHAIGFNPVDYKLREGRYDSPLPVVLGSDCAGVIAEVGEGVEEFEVGDEVYAFVFSKTSNGTYAESVTLPSAYVAKKPTNVTMEEAASIPLAALTAYRLVVETRPINPGAAVFISAGSGGVGSFAIQLAGHLGARRICTTAGSQESAQYIHETLEVPHKHILHYKGLSQDSQVKKLRAINGEVPFEACYDLVGGQMKAICIDLCRVQGHVGSILDEPDDFPIPLWSRKNSLAAQKSITFHFGFLGAEDYFGTPATWAVYQNNLNHLTLLFERGILKVPRVTHLGPLSVATVREAHAFLEEGHVKGKLIMTV